MKKKKYKKRYIVLENVKTVKAGNFMKKTKKRGEKA